MQPPSLILAVARVPVWSLALLAIACSASPATSAGDGAADLQRPDLRQPDSARWRG